MTPHMTHEEIKKRYSDAKDKPYQITVLAELNNCTRKEIKQILAGDEPAKAEPIKNYQTDYDKGLLDSEIAKKHGVKTADVAEWRKGKGLTRNSRKRSEDAGNSRKQSEADGVTIRDATVVTEPAEVVPTPNDIPASTQPSNPVTRPAHYTQGDIETIDYIRDKLTAEEFAGYCKGNILKYISRERHKNGVEDLKKAQVYLTWAIERREGDR